jgi:hypothetical protein
VYGWNSNGRRPAFGWSLEEYLYFGGYPGAATLIHEKERWRRYLLDSLIETTLARHSDDDASGQTRPAAAILGCEYSS